MCPVELEKFARGAFREKLFLVSKFWVKIFLFLNFSYVIEIIKQCCTYVQSGNIYKEANSN